MKSFESILFLCIFFVVTLAEELSKTDDDDDSADFIDDAFVEGDESKFLALVIMKENKDTVETLSISNEDDNDNNATVNYKYKENYYTDNEVDAVENLLRRRPWKGCLKTASKTCKKACKAAVKDACAYHDCRRKLKKTLKKECKRSCKSYFIGD